MSSKKSQAGSTFVLLLVVIVIFILFIIFMWIINNITAMTFITKGIFGERNVVVRISNSYNSLYSLESYLLSEYEVDVNGKRENITIADMIRLWNIYNGINYKNAIESETEKIFQQFVNKDSNMPCYYFEAENYISKTEGFSYARGKIPESLASIQIGDKYLANSKEKATIEIPLFDNKTTTAALIINNLCIK